MRFVVSVIERPKEKRKVRSLSFSVYGPSLRGVYMDLLEAAYERLEAQEYQRPHKRIAVSNGFRMEKP